MEAALAACRFTHYFSAMIVFGASVYLWLFAAEGLRVVLAAPLRGLLIGASLVLVVGAPVWLALLSAGMADDWSGAWDPDTLRSVIFGTAFGTAWIIHFLLSLALLASFAIRGEHRWALRACLAGLALASLSLTGHAAMQVGAVGALHRANDAVHLLCGGGWIGGLMPFMICLSLSAEPKLRREATEAMMRFSTTGHFAVALLIVTGIANIAMTSGALPFPPSTPYRALLMVKILLVAGMVVLAVLNRYVLAPRLGRDASAQTMLRTACLAEVALGALVIGLVSVFGLLEPF